MTFLDSQGSQLTGDFFVIQGRVPTDLLDVLIVGVWCDGICLRVPILQGQGNLKYIQCGSGNPFFQFLLLRVIFCFMENLK